jgi:hypothetical protein
MLQHVSEILERKRGDEAGLKWARVKTRPIPSMRRKRTCPACRKRVQCTLSLGVYRSPASGEMSVSLCHQHRREKLTNLLDIGNLGRETLRDL